LAGEIRVKRAPILFVLAGASGAAAQEDGKALLDRLCTKCHNLTATLRQHNSRERWGEIVDDMVAKGMEAKDAEIERVIEYLAATQGAKVNVNKAAAGDLARVLEISAEAAAAVVSFREKQGPFRSIEDLKKVPALGGKEIDSKKDRVEF
jgi:competence protein ComEA